MERSSEADEPAYRSPSSVPGADRSGNVASWSAGPAGSAGSARSAGSAGV